MARLETFSKVEQGSSSGHRDCRHRVTDTLVRNRAHSLEPCRHASGIGQEKGLLGLCHVSWRGGDLFGAGAADLALLFVSLRIAGEGRGARGAAAVTGSFAACDSLLGVLVIRRAEMVPSFSHAVDGCEAEWLAVDHWKSKLLKDKDYNRNSWLH